MFTTSIQYLCIVSNIVTQADETGFEFLRAKCAGVVLVMRCARQQDMQCQWGDGVGQKRDTEEIKGRWKDNKQVHHAVGEERGRGRITCR